VVQRYRLTFGGRIDRQEELTFQFNGKTLEGYRGDTLASALLANGLTLIARSFKYHRPRGIMGSGPEEPNALLQIGSGARSLPNQKATQVELYEGLVARSVNAWPSVQMDFMSANGLLSSFLPPGFYYKTFKWPAKFWKFYEHILRSASGFGTVPTEPDVDRYEKRHAHCDVLVVGGGPAGLAAALESGRTGARVTLIDDQPEFGGRLLDGGSAVYGDATMSWLDASTQELSEMPNVRLLPRSTAFGYYDHNALGVLERVADHVPRPSGSTPRQVLWRIRAKEVVIATGAFERPLVFHDNDRPGIMLASAVLAYANRYAVVPGKRPVVFTNNDNAYWTAISLASAGVKPVVVDLRERAQGDLPARARNKGVEVLEGFAVSRAFGGKAIQAIELRKISSAGAPAGSGGSTRRLDCDLLAVSGGWTPALDMHCQSGARAQYDDARACFVPGQSVQRECSAGACSGSFHLNEAVGQGSVTGAKAAQRAGFGSGRPSENTFAFIDPKEETLKPTWLVPSPFPLGRGPKQFVDFQNDTSAADIALAVRESFHSVEHIKRYTLLGFGTDQGKLSNLNGIGILSQVLKKDMNSIGTTTFRPAYSPIAFGALAGRDVGFLADPVRKTAIHEWHEEAGAVFENVGQWKRPWYFPKPGESMHGAVQRECLATQRSVGVLDASTLGKIDVQGPDAAEFLNRIYTNDKARLAVGRCSYGLMLGEDGMVFDDGVTARLGESHFWLTTTTGGAARVMSWLERWLQTEWPELRVYVTSVTDHFAAISINGPNSRALVSELSEGIDLSGQAFPFMSFQEGKFAGVQARIFRISFSGELAYEVYVAADEARVAWDALFAAGKKYDITPYGTETMHVLRADKGYIIVGQDTDGSLTPVDLGMNWIISKGKDFLGKRSLSRSDTSRSGRKQLIGLLTEDPKEVLPEGAQILEGSSVSVPAAMLGHVTSSYQSGRVGRSIALAVMKSGQSRLGDSVCVTWAGGSVIKATVTKPVFYDPEGTLQNA
jgi:sarcosine oxidase subunit alpha